MKGYDNWKLDTPEDSDILETSIPTYYGTSEEDIQKFMEELEKLVSDYGLKERIEDL